MNEHIQATEPSVDRKFSERDRVLASSPDSLKTRHELYLGDARDMKELADRPIHLAVTSPPYWTLKRYDGTAGANQLGHHEDYEGFHDELGRVWSKCYRNLVPGGRLCVVV